MPEPMSEERLQILRMWERTFRTDNVGFAMRDLLGEIDRLRAENEALHGEADAYEARIAELHQLLNDARAENAALRKGPSVKEINEAIEAIRDWWNDPMRKVWREDLENPVRKEQHLNELRDAVLRALGRDVG